MTSKVVAILGADWSRLSVAVLNEINDLGSKIPLISAGTTTPSLSSSTVWPSFFRTIYSDDYALNSVLPVLSSQLSASGGQPSWAVIYSLEAFGEGAHDVIQRYAQARGELFADMGFSSGTSLENMTALVSQLLSSSENKSRAEGGGVNL